MAECPYCKGQGLPAGHPGLLCWVNPDSPHYRKEVAERRLAYKNKGPNKQNIALHGGVLEINGHVINLIDHEQLLRESGVEAS